MRAFARWPREKIESWIDHLETQVALGVTSITNPDTGTASYDLRTAMRTLDLLYARLDVLDGKSIRPPRIGTIVPRIHPDR